MSIYERPDGYVYMRGPIDWWWGWSPLSDLQAQPEEKEGFTSPYEVHGPWYGHRNRDLEALVEHAIDRIRADGRWEGDISQGPYVAGLVPSNDADYVESDVMVGFKQSNNGTVFVWSPFPLPHLEES